jgi:hypothetical protein
MSAPTVRARECRVALEKLADEVRKDVGRAADLCDEAAQALLDHKRDIAIVLIREAQDIEFDIFGECEVTGAFAEAIGIDVDGDRDDDE